MEQNGDIWKSEVYITLHSSTETLLRALDSSYLAYDRFIAISGSMTQRNIAAISLYTRISRLRFVHRTCQHEHALICATNKRVGNAGVTFIVCKG